jgi:hypothetical protein
MKQEGLVKQKRDRERYLGIKRIKLHMKTWFLLFILYLATTGPFLNPLVRCLGHR